MKYIYITLSTTVISGILLAATGQALSQTSGSAVNLKSVVQNSVNDQTLKRGSAPFISITSKQKGSSVTASSPLSVQFTKSASKDQRPSKVSGSAATLKSGVISYIPTTMVTEKAQVALMPSSGSSGVSKGEKDISAWTSSGNSVPASMLNAKIMPLITLPHAIQVSGSAVTSGSALSSGTATISGASVLDPTVLVPDYAYFYQGITACQQENYVKAVKIFSTFKGKFPSSGLMNTTYLYYYQAKAYYGNKQYSLAIQAAKKTTFAPFEMTFVIGESYADMKQNSLAKQYLLKLFFNGYVSSGVTYEKMALKTLSKIDPYYSNIISVMYTKDFTNLSLIEVPDQEKIANYFIGLSDFSSALSVDNKLLDEGGDSYIEQQKLLCLYSLKQYQTAINYGMDLLSTNTNDMTYYYIGVCYSRFGDLENAIKWLNKMQNSSSLSTKKQLLGRYYFLLKNYKMAVTYLKNQTDSNSLQMLIECYQQIGDTSDATAAINTLLSTNPTLDLSAYYRYTLYKQTLDNQYLYDIIKYNINSFYYEYALTQLISVPKMKDYPVQKYTSKYSDTVNKIQALINMQFYSGAMICLQNSDLEKVHKTFYNYLAIMIYQGQGYYGTALFTAIQNYQEFYKYENLFQLLYPRYYLDSVSQAATNTGLSPALIFAIIRQESGFNSGAISAASAYGLMQMTVPTSKEYDSNASIQKLLDPDYNVNLGSQELAYLMKLYNGNILKVAAAYNAGVAAVDRWQNTYGSVTDDNIPYQETQNYVRKIVNNYDKYNRLYYTQSNAVGTYLIEPDSPTIQVSPLPPGAPSGGAVILNISSSQAKISVVTVQK